MPETCNINHLDHIGIAVKDIAKAVEKEARRYDEAVYKSVELRLATLSPTDTRMMVYAKSFLGPIENYISPHIQSQIQDMIPQ